MKALTPPRLLAATAAACFLLPSCQRNSEAKNDPQWWRLEADRIDVANQVELFELKLSKQTAGDQRVASVPKLEAEVKRGAARQLELAAERDALKQEIDLAKQDMEAIKAEWMHSARTAATGREFAKFTGAGGRTYENAVVTRVTDVGVEFRHATGTARLAANDLTPAQHEMFGLDREIAGEAMRQEKETALAYHSNVDAVVAARDANEEKDEKRVTSIAAASKPAPRETPSFASASVDTASRSRLSEPPKSVGRVNTRDRSSNTTVYYSSYYYRPYYYRSYYGYGVRRSAESRASIFYDPYTGGAPTRVNVPSRNYQSYGGGSSYRPRAYNPPASSMRSPSSTP
jgi:hypothetical protein